MVPIVVYVRMGNKLSYQILVMYSILALVLLIVSPVRWDTIMKMEMNVMHVQMVWYP